MNSNNFRSNDKRSSNQGKDNLNPASLSNCLNYIKLDWEKDQTIAALWRDWPQIAGTKLAANSTPLTFQRGILTIGVLHPQWIQAVMFNRNQLLAALKAEGHKVKDLRIKQHHPQKKLERKSELSIWNQHPSRYDIHGKKNCPICNTPSPAGEIALWKKCGFCRREELSN